MEEPDWTKDGLSEDLSDEFEGSRLFFRKRNARLEFGGYVTQKSQVSTIEREERLSYANEVADFGVELNSRGGFDDICRLSAAGFDFDTNPTNFFGGKARNEATA